MQACLYQLPVSCIHVLPVCSIRSLERVEEDIVTKICMFTCNVFVLILAPEVLAYNPISQAADMWLVYILVIRTYVYTPISIYISNLPTEYI